MQADQVHHDDTAAAITEDAAPNAGYTRKPRARSTRRHVFPPREVQLLQAVRAGRLRESRILIDGGVDIECKE